MDPLHECRDEGVVARADPGDPPGRSARERRDRRRRRRAEPPGRHARAPRRDSAGVAPPRDAPTSAKWVEGCASAASGTDSGRPRRRHRPGRATLPPQRATTSARSLLLVPAPAAGRRPRRATRRAHEPPSWWSRTLGRSFAPQPAASSRRAIGVTTRERASRSRAPETRRGGPCRPAPSGQLDLRPSYLTVVGMPLILPAFELLELRGDRGPDRTGNPRAPLAVADTADLRAEGACSCRPAACPGWRLDRVVHGDVDALESARHHPRAEIALVSVDADTEDALLVRRVEDAEAALAGDLELDDRALGDLVERRLLALRLSDEVVGVVVQRLDARDRPSSRRTGSRRCSGRPAGS